jgi:hypothetical protein
LNNDVNVASKNIKQKYLNPLVRDMDIAETYPTFSNYGGVDPEYSNVGYGFTALNLGSANLSYD